MLSAVQFRTLLAENFPGRLGELGSANTYWQNEIYRDAKSSDINLSARVDLFGKIPSRLSLNRLDQQGLRQTSKFDRTTASLSLNTRLFDDHLKVGLNANYSNEDNRFADGAEGNAITFDSTQPVRSPGSPYGGFFEFLNYDGSAASNVSRNPVSQLLQTRNVSNADRLFGNLNPDYKFHFLTELRLVTNLGYDRTDRGGSLTRLGTSALGVNGEQEEFIGNESRYEQTRTNTSADSYFIYENDFKDFGLKLTAGYSYQKFES